MRRKGSHLPARLALAVLSVGLAMPATAASGQAANDSLSLTVHMGYQDVVKLGEWMPVTVDIRNSGDAIDGTLEIQEALTAQPGVRGFAAYRQAISLAQGATKRVRGYIIEEATGATVTARILQNGRVSASQDATAGSTTSALIGVLSDQGTALDDFAAIHPGSLAARVVHLRADDLADTAIPLRAFDILAIDDFPTDGLTAAQRVAIADYVRAGGQLLLGTGAAWRKTLAGLPTGILPMEINGTTVLSATPELGGSTAEVATGTATSGRAWLAHGNQPLILERTVGAGTVSLATFDWNQESIGTGAVIRGVLRQVMSRAFFGPGGSAQNFAYGVGGPAGFGFGAQPSVGSKSGALQPVLGNMPGLDLPSLQLTGALVLVYVLLVGPVNYLVLRRLRRRALAWVTIPVIALVAAAGAYGAGISTKGRSVQLNQVAILHLQSGTDRAYQETYTGIMAPTRGDYEAALSGGRLFVSPISANGGGGFASSDSIRVDADRGQVTLPQMTAFALRGFATEGTTTAPQLVARLGLANGKLTWTIENHSSLTFTDAVVIAGDTFQTVGPLKPGATTTVSLTPKPANPFGQPLYTRVYGNSSSGIRLAEDMTAQRETMAKTQILSLLPTGTSFKGVVSASNPLLVAWTGQSFQDVTVSGSRPRSTVQSAVALSLAVDQIGTGPLPAGVVSGRIVDVVGETTSGPPGMLLMQNGTVTYEFQPLLAAGTHLEGASLSATNPYGPKFAGAPPNGQPGATVQGQVWDWSRSTWNDIAYQDNGTTAVPSSAIDPSSGLIRLRLTTTNGGLLAGSISLAGTVK